MPIIDPGGGGAAQTYGVPVGGDLYEDPTKMAETYGAAMAKQGVERQAQNENNIRWMRQASDVEDLVRKSDPQVWGAWGGSEPVTAFRDIASHLPGISSVMNLGGGPSQADLVTQRNRVQMALGQLALGSMPQGGTTGAGGGARGAGRLVDAYRQVFGNTGGDRDATLAQIRMMQNQKWAEMSDNMKWAGRNNVPGTTMADLQAANPTLSPRLLAFAVQSGRHPQQIADELAAGQTGTQKSLEMANPPTAPQQPTPAPRPMPAPGAVPPGGFGPTMEASAATPGAPQGPGTPTLFTMEQAKQLAPGTRFVDGHTGKMKIWHGTGQQ